MLTTAKAWELKDGDVIVYKGDHYHVDAIRLNRPSLGWHSIHCHDRNGILTALMFEGNCDINVVRTRNYSPQRESAQRKDASWRSRRVPGSSR